MLCFFGGKQMINRLREYFSNTEILIWSISSLLVIVSFFLFDRSNVLILSASLIGVTYLILNAKGNPLGQVLVILFSVLYGIISFTFTYYGEMITYLGMTMPMAVFALISWLRNPFNGNRAEVTVGTISKAETVFMIALSAIVTVLFYFILQAFHTANILPSTLSVTTSFLAALASLSDTRYISVVICFAVFLFNDIYSFFCWQSMKKRQSEERFLSAN